MSGQLKRILIVDDSPLILQASQHALQEAGFVVETRSGVEDLGEQGSTGFDLILMDVQMPELYGDDVAGIMKRCRAVETPIYLFSMLPVEELAERAKEAEVAGYIAKSAGLEYLVTEVQRILG